MVPRGSNHSRRVAARRGPIAIGRAPQIIGDALAREHINVTAVRSQSREELAFMRFTFDVSDLGQLRRAFAAVKEVPGVIRAARG